MESVYYAKKKKNLKDYEGKFFDGINYKIFKENVDIYTDDNKLLCKFRKNMLKEVEINKLLHLKSAAKSGYTRPNASGYRSKEEKYKWIISKSSGKRLHVLTSKSNSGIVGFYDSVSHFGYSTSQDLNRCRMTAFTCKNIDSYNDCLKIFQKINLIFKKLVPERYKNQCWASKKIDPEFIIPKTVFTTITVNKNFRTALHRDAGDFKDGFGIMIVVSEGEPYDGSYTLFPEYQIGIDCRSGDLLAFDVHELHCNSQMLGQEKSIRLSFIFYLREKMMVNCPLRVFNQQPL